MADTVSISKEYLSALLRRLQYQSEGTVTIGKDEHDALLQSAADYKSLRSALISGGVPPEDIDVLINGTIHSGTPQKSDPSLSEPAPVKPTRQGWSAEAITFVPRPQKESVFRLNANVKPEQPRMSDWKTHIPSSVSRGEIEDRQYEDLSTCNEIGHAPDYIDYCDEGEEKEQEEDNHGDRSLILRGISKSTTLADVLSVIRGGQVLNVYIRPYERSAHVAFVDPIAAEKFLIHSKRSDIYIKGKRIEAFWDDRQHYLQAHIARRIHNNGASRNLVIQFATPDMTEEAIREDLDHIHRLKVVSVRREGTHVWVSLNSVQHAITAKTCMLSRLKYKGSRIEFYPDDCAQLLPFAKRPPLHENTNLQHKKSTVNINRFQMLTVDDEEEERNGIDHFGHGVLGKPMLA